jgi:hypothetical protein
MGMDTDKDILGRVGPNIADIDNMAKSGSSNVSTNMKVYSFWFGSVQSIIRSVCFFSIDLKLTQLQSQPLSPWILHQLVLTQHFWLPVHFRLTHLKLLLSLPYSIQPIVVVRLRFVAIYKFVQFLLFFFYSIDEFLQAVPPIF